MTNTAPAATEEFKFSAENLEAGDLIHITHAWGETAIAIIEIHGQRGVWGMGTSSNNTWCGHYGRIIFYKPIRIGEPTDATFNQTGGRPNRLEVIPRRLIQVRHGKTIRILRWPSPVESYTKLSTGYFYNLLFSSKKD